MHLDKGRNDCTRSWEWSWPWGPSSGPISSKTTFNALFLCSLFSLWLMYVLITCQHLTSWRLTRISLSGTVSSTLVSWMSLMTCLFFSYYCLDHSCLVFVIGGLVLRVLDVCLSFGLHWNCGFAFLFPVLLICLLFTPHLYPHMRGDYMSRNKYA